MSAGPTITPKEIMQLVRAGLLTNDQARKLLESMMIPPMVVVGSDLGPTDVHGSAGSWHNNVPPTSSMQPFQGHLYSDTASGVAEMNRLAQQAVVNQPPRWSLYDKLKMRLGLEKNHTFGVDFLHIFNSGQKVFVFMVHDNQAAYVEDDQPTMFPSDAFMARYHLVHAGLTAGGKPEFPGEDTMTIRMPTRKP